MENAAEMTRKPKVGRPPKQKGAGRPKLKYRSYAKAKLFVHKLKLTSYNDWLVYARTDQCPNDIPTRPEKVYEDFVSFNDWLGKNDFATFDLAKDYIKQFAFKSMVDFFERYDQCIARPFKVPKQPDKYYKEEWQGWKDFLQYETKDNQTIETLHKARDEHHQLNKKKNYRSFMDAAKFISSLRLRDFHDFIQWRSSYQYGDIPWSPDLFYGNEWRGWKVFLGHDPMLTFLDQNAVLYIAKHPQDPGNVYRIGINKMGPKDTQIRCFQNGMKVVRMYDHNAETKYDIQEVLRINTREWYEAPEAYIVQNIYDLFNDLFNVTSICK